MDSNLLSDSQMHLCVQAADTATDCDILYHDQWGLRIGSARYRPDQNQMLAACNTNAGYLAMYRVIVPPIIPRFWLAEG